MDWACSRVPPVPVLAEFTRQTRPMLVEVLGLQLPDERQRAIEGDIGPQCVLGRTGRIAVHDPHPGTIPPMSSAKNAGVSTCSCRFLLRVVELPVNGYKTSFETIDHP